MAKSAKGEDNRWGDLTMVPTAMAKTWNVEEMPLLEGVVIEKGEHTFPDLRGANRAARFFNVGSDNDVAVTVWESMQLRQLMNDVQVDDYVIIEYLGTEDIGRGRMLKQYKAGYRISPERYLKQQEAYDRTSARIAQLQDESDSREDVGE